MKIRIMDYRNKQKFQVDDQYINGYADLCGWKATLVYLILCRHSNKDQFSFPSIATMAKKLNVSKDTVIDGIKSLEKWNIIKVDRKKQKGKRSWEHNTYYLLDKSEWKPKQVADNADKPSRSKPLNPVANTDTKDTHMQGNIFNDAELSSAGWLFEKQLQRLKESKDKAQKIIGYYWDVKKPKITNERQAEIEFKRSIKTAIELTAFEIERIEETLIFIRDKVRHKWTLETVSKYITEDLAKLKREQEPPMQQTALQSMPEILGAEDLEKIGKEIIAAGSDRQWYANKGAIRLEKTSYTVLNPSLLHQLKERAEQVRKFNKPRHN